MSELIISTRTTIKNFLLDLLFPQTCLGCDTFCPKSLCAECKSKIRFQERLVCMFCGAATTDGRTCPFDSVNQAVNQFLFALDYEYPIVKKLIKSFKYNFMLDVGEVLGDLLSSYFKKSIDRGIIDTNNLVIVAVPLSRKRLRWRGFNQAEVLAQSIGRSLDIPFDNEILLKRSGFWDWVGIQKSQAEINDRESRLANVKNLFFCPLPDQIKNKNILLVDDVCTTGATLKECAQVLRSAGAQKITVVVLAHG